MSWAPEADPARKHDRLTNMQLPRSLIISLWSDRKKCGLKDSPVIILSISRTFPQVVTMGGDTISGLALLLVLSWSTSTADRVSKRHELVMKTLMGKWRP